MNEVRNAVSFMIEFPDRGGTDPRQRPQRSINPVTWIVGDAARRVPDRGFVEEPGARRDRSKG